MILGSILPSISNTCAPAHLSHFFGPRKFLEFESFPYCVCSYISQNYQMVIALKSLT